MMFSLTWHRLLACGENAKTTWTLIPLLLLLGCTTDTAPKTSHFEHDHLIAPHWPSDLADAAAKIRDRLVWLEDGRPQESHDHDGGNDHDHDHDLEHGHDHANDLGHDSEPWAEIVEIVAWIPEIAADTNLAEADWLPIYHATESLSANLRSADGVLTDDNRDQLESLCELVDDAAKTIPDLLPPSVKGNS